MTKSKGKPKTTPANQTASQRLRALLDGGFGDTATDARLRELVDFWAQLRRILAVNTASSGLEELDDAAAAVMLQDDATPARLTQPVLLLMTPDAMAVGQTAEHAVFAPPATAAAPPAPARTKRSSRRFPVTSVKQPPAKKLKKSASLPFDVPDDTPAEVIADLRRIAERAAAQNKTPAQVSYPWRGKRAWYEPAEHEDLHLAHWRFVMRHRNTFFLLALYAPSTNPQYSQYRRSLKAKAIQARLQFISANVEEFGWFGFLDRFENSVHDTLLWLGGKPAKHSTGAKDKLADGNLASLFLEDPARYREMIKRMLDPLRIDADGYQSIPELLEQTQALDPTRNPHQRLSDRALARIVVDVNANRDYRGEWVGNKTTGLWKELVAYEPLQEEQQKVSDLIKARQRVATFDVKPFKPTDQAAEDSDFKVLDVYTVLAPTVPFTAGGPHFVAKKSKARPIVSGLESDDDSEEEFEHEDDASEAEDDVSEPGSDTKDSDDDDEQPPPSSPAEADEKKDDVDEEPQAK